MKYNILVVDDEEDIRLSIAGLLEDENYEVRVVKNSDEALDAISERVPDLVLLDIWLENSKLDGMDLLSEINSKSLFGWLKKIQLKSVNHVDKYLATVFTIQPPPRTLSPKLFFK
mgnify:CR=1 FL=1